MNDIMNVFNILYPILYAVDTYAVLRKRKNTSRGNFGRNEWFFLN